MYNSINQGSYSIIIYTNLRIGIASKFNLVLNTFVEFILVYIDIYCEIPLNHLY